MLWSKNRLGYCSSDSLHLTQGGCRLSSKKGGGGTESWLHPRSCTLGRMHQRANDEIFTVGCTWYPATSTTNIALTCMLGLPAVCIEGTLGYAYRDTLGHVQREFVKKSTQQHLWTCNRGVPDKPTDSWTQPPWFCIFWISVLPLPSNTHPHSAPYTCSELYPSQYIISPHTSCQKRSHCTPY